MTAFTRAVVSLLVLAALARAPFLRAEGEPRLADLGDFPLVGGGAIRECRVGYRTFGTLNPERSNAVLFPTWFGGTSQDLVNLGLIGPGKLADTSRWFVVAVDAFGNGVSSSPSNSRLQPGRAFPEFTVRDLVRAQHRLMTAYLGLERLHAVVGVSMGGMQALQWARTLPGVARRVVSIAGTPRAAPSDLALYDAGLRALDAAGSLSSSETWGPETLAALIALLALTPAQDRDRPPQDPEAVLARYDFTNWARQLRAMTRHDIYAGAAEREAARAIRAKLLLVVSRRDLLVSPEPSLALAGALKAETRVLDSECGHFAVLCEGEKIARAVSAFLNRKD